MRLARYFMGSRESPFLQLSDCWRKDSLDDIEARATALAAQVDEVSKIPTLMGEASGAELASRIARGMARGRGLRFGQISSRASAAASRSPMIR
jgi:hypothetical protein